MDNEEKKDLLKGYYNALAYAEKHCAKELRNLRLSGTSEPPIGSPESLTAPEYRSN